MEATTVLTQGAGAASLFNFWIGDNGVGPFCLLVTTNAATDSPDHLVSFLRDDGDVWTLDVLIGSAEHIGRGIGAQMLKSFLAFCMSKTPIS